MLVRMRNAAQSWIAKFVAGVIIVVLVLFGFGAFNLFTVSEPIVASVDDVDITEGRLVNEIEAAKQSFKDLYGEQISDEQLDNWVDEKFALERLVNTQLLTNATADLGLRLSEVQFQQAIRENPAFQTDDGEFDEQVFQETLQRSGLSARSLRELEEASDVRQQLLNVLENTAFSTPSETEMLATFDHQARDFSSLVFSLSKFEDPDVITDAEVQSEYEFNSDAYMTNGEFDFAYVQVQRDSFLPEEELSEEEVQELYENEVEAKQSSAERRGSHILIKTDTERTQEEALEEINQIVERLGNGEDFSELATELSEDAGSVANGGDLGFAQRSTYVQPFADKLWSMEIDEVSEPVETMFGYHIIKLLEIQDVEIESLVARRDALIESRNLELAGQRMEEESANIDKLAFENADSLDPIATEYDVEIQTLEGVDAFTRDGLLAENQVQSALFDTDVIDNNFNSRVVNLYGESLVVGRLIERTDPQVRPFEEVEEEIKTMLLDEAATAARDSALEGALAQLKDDLNFDAAEDVAQDTWQVYSSQARTDTGIDPAVLEVAFKTPLPSDGERVIVEADSVFTSDRFIVVVSSLELADYSVLPSSTQEELTTRTQDSSKSMVFSSFLSGLRGEADIDSVISIFEQSTE